MRRVLPALAGLFTVAAAAALLTGGTASAATPSPSATGAFKSSTVSTARPSAGAAKPSVSASGVTSGTPGAASTASASRPASSSGATFSNGAASGTAKASTPIEHFVFLMQGDRTFDNYFGTYPGADGLPPNTCQVFVLAKPGNGCVKPFALEGRTVTALAPGESVTKNQFNGGKMDGFVAAYVAQGRDGTSAMGYYDRTDLPFTWAVADQYVLFDKFFASAFHGTRANRSYWVAAAPPPGGARSVPKDGYGNGPTIFDRLQSAGVSWKFYVQDYDPKQTFRTSTTAPVGQAVRVPLLDYARFVDDPALNAHIVDLSEYYKDLASGSLPSVAYIATAGPSERSSRSIPAGQDLLRDLTTQLMLSPYWRSSAFMWTYDGSGGWYDHVAPPKVNGEQLGFRVPALLLSPYAKQGHIESGQMDYTSALKFIEENWSLSPLTARDASARSIASVFDFTAPARPPVLLNPEKTESLAVVDASAAYKLYGLAATLAVLLFVLAFTWPSVLRVVAPGIAAVGAAVSLRLPRRPRAVAAATGDVDEAVVTVPDDVAVEDAGPAAPPLVPAARAAERVPVGAGETPTDDAESGADDETPDAGSAASGSEASGSEDQIEDAAQEVAEPAEVAASDAGDVPTQDEDEAVAETSAEASVETDAPPEATSEDVPEAAAEAGAEDGATVEQSAEAKPVVTAKGSKPRNGTARTPRKPRKPRTKKAVPSPLPAAPVAETPEAEKPVAEKPAEVDEVTASQSSSAPDDAAELDVVDLRELEVEESR